MSAEQRRDYRQALTLKRIHSAYDRAKSRLARMSTEYTDLGVKLQAAETRASSLRSELESEMRKIRGEMDAGQRGTELSGGHAKAFTMSLSELPLRSERGATRLAREVRDLKSELGRVQAKENRQAAELEQMRSGIPAASFGTDGNIAQGWSRPSLSLHAERFMSEEKLAKLARLDSVDVRLEAENRKICELCAQSALLRASRQQTCSICSQHAPGEVEGDTDLEGPTQDQQHGDPSLASAAISMFVSGWKEPQPTQQQQQLSLALRGPGGSREALGNIGAMMFAPAQGSSISSAAKRAVQGQELVQIDDEDHMGTAAMDGPRITAYIMAAGERYVVGRCAPSPDELKFESQFSLCRNCRSQLGVDVESIGHVVQCSQA